MLFEKNSQGTLRSPPPHWMITIQSHCNQYTEHCGICKAEATNQLNFKTGKSHKLALRETEGFIGESVQ